MVNKLDLCLNCAEHTVKLDKHKDTHTIGILQYRQFKKISNYVAFTQPLHHKQETAQGQYLSGVQLVLIQSFPSLRLVAKPRLKNPTCPTIYL